MPNAEYAVAVSSDVNGTNSNACYIKTADRTANGFQIKQIANGTFKSPVSFSYAVFATNALPPKGGTGTDAWGSCQSDGTVNGSFNVDSVTRTGAGKYRVDFTTPMPTANYSITTSTENTSIKASYFNRTTTGFEIYTINNSGSTDGGFSFTVNATNATLPSTFTVAQFEDLVARVTALENA